MQQEFYSLYEKCPEIKYFNTGSFPEAKARLELLCELKCDTSTDSSYFYGLSRYCQNIQSLTITNIDTKVNYGIAKLIEFQKNLKRFEWEDQIYEEYLTEDPYKEIFVALEKKADSLNHLRIFFEIVDGVENTLL
jgi:hypothetical protein